MPDRVWTRRRFLRQLASASATVSVGAPLLAACRSVAVGPSPSPVASATPSAPRPAPMAGGLFAEGGQIVDGAGKEVRLTGINWFGFETQTFAPHGLWSRHWKDMLDQIVQAGFNCLRLPFSNQVLEPSSVPTSIDFTKNPDLRDLSSLQLFDRIIDGAAGRGLSIILDRHRPTADGQSELWYTDRVPEPRWIDDWVALAARYRHQPAVIGADLHNEPHGPATWGDGSARTDWRAAAERAGNAILATNPTWLIVVEGIERYADDWYWWGGNLAGARAYPVQLTNPQKLVYSAHDYGPGVYGQPWFAAPDFPRNLPDVWQRHWGYLRTEGIAPVLIGEFGGRSVGTDPEGVWQRTLVDFLKSSHLSYTYWCWNPDSGDTGGLLQDDWMTINPAKLAVLSAYQWPLLQPPSGQPSAG